MNPAAITALFSGNVENAIAASTPGGIEAQERNGQAAFVNSASLPKEMSQNCTREKLEQCGIKFGDDIDEIFVSVQLPDGWSKQATEHAMHSSLLDDKGRIRAHIFYKAAFYDRRAWIRLVTRYSVQEFDPCDEAGTAVEYGNHSHIRTAVKDGDTVVNVIGIRESSDHKTYDAHYAEAYDWLNKNFPGWENPLAYWD